MKAKLEESQTDIHQMGYDHSVFLPDEMDELQ